MSTVEALREFLNRRLSAAAGEIFSVFLPTLVQYQEQVQNQQRLLQISRRETTKPHTTDGEQQHFCIEEQLWNKQHHSSLYQEEPEPPQIKEEQKEPENPQINNVLLGVKQFADTIIETAVEGKSKHRENLDSHNSVREFINKQLTIAAGEIFAEFQQTIVQYQEEIQAQQRLLEFTLIPQINLNSIDSPEEQINSCLEHKEPEARLNKEHDEPVALQIKEEQQETEAPQIKEEEDYLHSRQEEHVVLKQEVYCFKMITAYEKSQVSEPVLDGEILAFQDSVVAGSQHQKKVHLVDTESTRKAELNSNKRLHSNNVENSPFNPQSSLSLSTKTFTGEKPHSCETCGKSFRRRGDLLVHVRIHSGEKPYSCVTCGKSFRRNSHLLGHKSIHTGEKPCLCVTCGKSFRRNCDLLRHLRIHRAEKPCSCIKCGERFSGHSDLVRHVRIHTGDKPHPCVTGRKNNFENVKNTPFKQSSLLASMKTHSDQKPQHPCETCGKCFRRRGDLSVHMRIHSGEKPYSCITCGKSFKRNSHLLGHLTIHTGEKPCLCVTCGKSFRRNCNLLRHMKIHIGEKSCSCVICGKSFIGSDDLLHHMRIHTGGEATSMYTMW